MGESWQYTDVLGIVTFINDKSEMEKYADSDAEVENLTISKDEDKTDYSKYLLPVVIIAAVMVLVAFANVGLLIYKSKKK